MAQSRQARQIVPIRKLASILDEFGQQALESIEEQGMLRVANALEAKAVELAPVNTGNLEASTVVRVEKRGSNVRGTVSFTAPYASTVHELPEEARGSRTRRKPGNEFGDAGPGYLLRPLRGFQQSMTRDLGKFLREVWGRKSRRGRRRG